MKCFLCLFLFSFIKISCQSYELEKPNQPLWLSNQDDLTNRILKIEYNVDRIKRILYLVKFDTLNFNSSYNELDSLLMDIYHQLGCESMY